jgi:predicted permease
MGDHPVDRELQFHVDQQIDAYMASGLSRQEAARRVRLEFGGVPQVKESCDDVRRWRAIEHLSKDLRFAWRLALKTPGLTLTIVLVLALAIGANSTIFAVVNGVLLKPLPYREPGRLVMVWNTVAKDQRAHNTISPADYRDFAAATGTLETLQAYFSFLSDLEVVIDDRTEMAHTYTVTPGVFDLLGRGPLLGRTFARGEYEPGVVLSHEYWQRRFGADSRAIGRTLQVAGQPFTIVGVMPAGFVFPYPGMLGPSGFTRVTAADMWVPMVFDGPLAVAERTVDSNGQPVRGVRWLGAIGRMKPRVTPEQVRADLAAVATRLADTYPNTNKGWGVTVLPAREQTVGAIRPALLLLFAGVGLVLLMAAVNVANLMLARSLARQSELATRVALGASRGRLVQQSIVESLLLAGAGGVLGFAFTRWGIQLLMAIAPPDLPRLAEVAPDWRVAAATAALSVGAGVLVGVLPAFNAAQVQPQAVLQEHGRGTSGSRAQHRYRAAMIVIELAFAVVLTIGTGLLLRSFAAIVNIDPGFEPAHLLTWQMNIPERLQTPDERRAFYQEFFNRMNRLPGVVSVGGTTRLPLGSTSVTTTVDIQGRPRPVSDLPEVEFRRSLHDFFATMHMPIVRGRGFSRDDGPNAPPVVVINETMAKRLFPDDDPIGQHLRTSGANSPWMDIVGIVGDIRHSGLDQPPAPEMYISYLQNPPVAPFIVIRTTGDPGALAAQVRAEARAFDKELPLYDMRTMDDVRSASVADRRFVTLLVGLFGALALVLAAVGIDGVMAVAVNERTEEMGVRLALGANPRQLVRIVVVQSGRLAALGIVLGLALTWLLVPLIRTQLFGVTATDPATLATVPLVLLAIAVSAAAVPAMRAAHVNPAQVLRKA